MNQEPTILARIRTRFRELVEKEQLLSAEVSVLAKPLTPEEAIGTPGRRDFPIIIGKERVIEASVLGARGHAFTDSAQEFIGTLRDVLELDLAANARRAIFIATFNAVLCHLGLTTATVHCKDEDPEKCANEIDDHLKKQPGVAAVGLIGLNPAIAERLIDTFGPAHVHITDLNHDNIGTSCFGVEIWDGGERTEELVRTSDIVVCTGTTLVNGTFDRIWELIRRHGKDYLVYGVTAAGVSELTGLNRMCPYGREG